MAIQINVRHPSPVSAMPRRGRKPRDGFEALVTPVSIPELPRSAFEPRPVIGKNQVGLHGIHVHRGAAWAPLRPSAIGHAVRAGDLLGFMRDGTLPGAGTLRDVRAALRFTPLHAGRMTTKGSIAEPADMELGDPRWHLDGTALGRVVREERERTAANLSDWVAGNLAVVGDEVMARTPPMLEALDHAGRINVYAAAQMGLGPYKVDGLRPDRMRELCASTGRPFDEGMEEALGLFEEWSAGLETDDDVRMLAERLPALVHSLAEGVIRAPGYLGNVRAPEEVDAALARLTPWRLRGACGGIRPEEVAEAIAAAEAALDDLRRAGMPLPPGMFNPGGLMDQARRWYLPRSGGIAPEDAESLAMLA